MSSKNIFLLGIIILLFLTVPLTLFLTQKNQDNRQQAAKATTLYFNTPIAPPQTTLTLKPGQEFSLDLFVNPGTNLVSTVKYVFSYNPAIFTPVPEKFATNQDVFRQNVEGPFFNNGQASGVVTIGNNPTLAASQTTRVASFVFKVTTNTSLLTGNEQISLQTGASQTQVYSVGENDSASENVLSSAIPATIAFDIPITPTIIQEVPTGEITRAQVINCPNFPSCTVQVEWQTEFATNVSLKFGTNGQSIPVSQDGSYTNTISLTPSLPVILYSGTTELDRAIIQNTLTPTPTPSPTLTPTPTPVNLTLKIDSITPKPNFRRDIKLSWNTVGDRTYSVYMKINNEGYPQNPVASGGLTATINGANNTQYTFKVVACSTSVSCVTSNEVTVPAAVSETDVLVNLAVFLHGIGNSGDNKNPNSALSNKTPKTTTKEVTVGFYNKTNSSQLIKEAKGTMTYVPVSASGGASLAVLEGYYDGIVTVPQVPEGEYTIKIRTDKYLQKVYPGIIAANNSISLDPVSLVSGDVNNDNKLDILDYNMIMDCYSDALPARACSDSAKKLATDLTDDGQNNHFDYNLFIRELSVQFGQ